MKVMIGLSGGVDSAVAAYLLKKQGYDVVAGFMRNWDSLTNNDILGNPTLSDDQCSQEKDYHDAEQVAAKLGIVLYRVDFVKEYWDSVFSYFLSEYKKGRTPNPDVFCNKYIKFDTFLSFARSKGCDMIAMGHYAKKETVDGLEYIDKAFDKNKDQSYFLSQINEAQIASCLFPLAGIIKPEVRRIAHELDLSSVMDKRDSTGVCFIGERDFRKFLQNYLPAKPGDVIDVETGKTIGRHVGVLYYTLGQRHGLGIGGVAGEGTSPWFVCKKDVAKNVIYVANGDEDENLNSDSCLISGINWIGPKPSGPYHVGVKFRYRQPDQGCLLSFEGADVRLTYDKPYKAVTPGQIAVFYDGERMLGGGSIGETYYKGKRTDI